MATPAKSGDLRFNVRFDKQYQEAADGGGTVSTWQDQFVRRADIRPLRGGEGVQAQRLVGTQPVIIIVRSDSETRQITSDWRAVEFKDGEAVRYYALKTAEDMERERKFITMVAEAGSTDGGAGE